MSETITASFVITTRQKHCLKQWAAADDRSVSYILRDILQKECDRREVQPNANPHQSLRTTRQK